MTEINDDSTSVSDLSRILVAIYSATGVGLMVGVLIGLSISPVVAAFIGAVGAALAVLLGLNENHFTIAKGIRIGTFGLMAIVGVLVGMYIRTHDLLAPSMEQQKQQYVQAGFSEADALAMVRNEQSLGEVANSKASVLFSKEISLSHCDMIQTGNDAELSWVDFKGNFTLEEGLWSSLAESTEGFEFDDDKKATLISVRDVLCKEDVLSFSEKECQSFEHLLDASSLDGNLRSPIGTLDRVRANIIKTVRPESREAAYSAVLYTFIEACAVEKD